MGANVANEVARGEFCEATLGCADPTHSTMLKPLFDTETFRISTTDDRVGKKCDLFAPRGLRSQLRRSLMLQLADTTVSGTMH